MRPWEAIGCVYTGDRAEIIGAQAVFGHAVTKRGFCIFNYRLNLLMNHAAR
jgi:hypothetical protein